MASVTALRELLEQTTLPADLADEIVSDTNTLWLLGVPEELVAGELILCHPPLGPGEVRAVVNQTGAPNEWRVTVVTRDRPGLLAGTSATLTNAGLSVVDVAVTVLPRSHLAMQRVTVKAGRVGAFGDDEWARLGRDLRSNLASGAEPGVAFVPRGPVVVEAQPQELGRAVVTIEAPDRAGLLHTTARWFEEHGCNVEACRAGLDGRQAKGVFVVTGTVDTALMAAELGGIRPSSIVTRVATTPLHVALGCVARMIGAAEQGVRMVSAAGRVATQPWRRG